MNIDEIFKLSRRDFLEKSAFGSAALVLAGPLKLFAATTSPFERNDPGVRPEISRATGCNFSILNFAHVTDTHITDPDNPLRGKVIDELPHMKAAYRPQEYMSVTTWDAVVHSVNENIKGKKLEFLISTGDQIDNALVHENEWFIAIAEGYFPEKHYVKRVRHKKMTTVLDPVGLELPWYATLGNHDIMVVGNIPADSIRHLVRRLSKLLDWDFSLNDIEWLVARYAYPVWHGLSPEKSPGANPPPANDGYYAFDANSFTRCIVLNTDNDDWTEGLARSYCEENEEKIKTEFETKEDLEEALDATIRDFSSWSTSRAAKSSLHPGGTCQGTIDPDQFDWMKRELDASPDKLVIIFSHHGPDSFLTPPGNITEDRFIETLAAYENVIAHIHGHTHKNLIVPRMSSLGTYWDITTCSLAEYPQEWRRISITDEGDGTGRIRCRMHGHGFLPARLIALHDDGASHKIRKMTGLPPDRDVNLVFAMPEAAAENIRKNHTPSPADEKSIKRIDEPVPEPAYDYVYTEREDDPACFVATAAFGTILAPEVDTLRRFRDKILSRSRAGRLATRTYYRLSPPLALFISKHEPARKITAALLLPVVTTVRLVWNP